MSLYADVHAALAAADVRYVVVGGMAVVLHGHVRATVDLDLVVDLERSAALRAVQALTDLGLLPRVPVAAEAFADPATRATWIAEKHMQVLSFYDPQHPAREVDLFVEYPLDFEALVGAAELHRLDGVEIPVASIDHLVAMKQAAGRPRDLDDVEALRALGRRP